MKQLSLQGDYSMSLAELLRGYVLVPQPQGRRIIRDLKLDSRAVVAGDLFVALKGYQDHGARYVDDAVARGARAVLIDQLDIDHCANPSVPVIAIEQLRQKLGELASRFFRAPSSRLKIIGVTGTNGKTSCVQYISRALSSLGRPCGSIGTLGFGSADQLLELDRTTPDAISVQRLLAYLAEGGATAVALEVSSHAVDQHRVSGVEFDTLVFTNLSHDHLDYHGTMEKYAATKKSLFLMPGAHHAVVNVDDTFGAQLASELSSQLKVHTYGIKAAGAEISASNLRLSAQGISARLNSTWGQGVIRSPLLGRFNLSNLLAVYAVLCIQGVSIEKALQAISQLSGVSGRMQQYGGGSLPLVVVDYAHTPEALRLVLETLREICEGQLWCLFGCGGDRDSSKRQPMGKIAELLADNVVVTSDNPRNENPEQITKEILSGFKRPANAVANTDRSSAIGDCIESAQVNDVVLVAGKGHENYQETAGVRVAFSDLEQVRKALNARAVKQPVKLT